MSEEKIKSLFRGAVLGAGSSTSIGGTNNNRQPVSAHLLENLKRHTK